MEAVARRSLASGWRNAPGMALGVENFMSDDPDFATSLEGYDIITLQKLIEREYSVPEPQTAEEVIGYYARRIAQAPLTVLADDVTTVSYSASPLSDEAIPRARTAATSIDTLVRWGFRSTTTRSDSPTASFTFLASTPLMVTRR